MAWIETPICVYDDISILIQQVAWGYEQPTQSDWNKALKQKNRNVVLQNACKSGYLSIAEWANRKRETNRRLRKLEDEIDLNAALNEACVSGYIDIAKWLRSEGADQLNISAWEACKGGHLDIVKWLKLEGGINMNNALSAAASHGRVDIVKWLVENGSTDINCAMWVACGEGRLVVAKWLRAQHSGVICPQCSIRDLMIERMCANGYLEVVKWVETERLADGVIMKYAYIFGNRDITEWSKLYINPTDKILWDTEKASK